MKSLLDYLPKEMLSEDEYPGSEAGRINQLKALPQPVSINGGSYSYSANVVDDPRTWRASDGSEIKIHTLRELGEYFDQGEAEDWEKFMDGYCDAQDLVQYGMIRKRAPRGQEDHETMNLQGESVTEDDKGATAEEVGNAIMHRIERQFPDTMRQYGDEVVADAIRGVAEFHAGAQELGSSDISIMVKEVLRDLERISIGENSISSYRKLAGLK